MAKSMNWSKRSPFSEAKRAAARRKSTLFGGASPPDDRHPAVELSFLTLDDQTILIDAMETIIEQNSAKTKSSLRTLPLVVSFRQYFEEVKAAQARNKEICGNSYNYAHVLQVVKLSSPFGLRRYFSNSSSV